MSALPRVEALSGAARYGVFDHGAHAFAWGPQGGAPVLWMSRAAILDGTAAIRGGVPICFPWFGGGPEGGRKPAHGFARIVPWRRCLTIDGTARGGPLVVDYRLDQSLAPRAPSFPHDFEARLRVVFAADHLQIDLDTRNTGASAFAFEAALHSYLVVGDIRRAVLSGLDGADYLDKAAGAPAGLQRQSGDVVFTGETDRVYASRAKVEILDPVLGRRLIVAKEGSGQTVIWNPWIDKAKAMADFGDEEWTGMVCVEAGAIGEGAVRLAPGGRHRLSQRVEAAALV